MTKTVEQLFAESVELQRREVEALERANYLATQPAPKRSRVCGSWPYCYHGWIGGAVFGCADWR